MYVCICRAVTDSQVKEAIEGGARCIAGVKKACGAGSDCGACHGVIRELLEESAEEGAPVQALNPVPGRAA